MNAMIDRACVTALPSQFFVSGTDTEVGKTVASAMLCRVLELDYWKPVQAGLEEETDSEKVARLAGATVHPERYRLLRPASPHAAAGDEGKLLRLSDFELPSAPRLLVEGAGGLRVPFCLDPLLWQTDLIQALGLPVVLVTRTTLGTLNHTFLSLAFLEQLGIPCLGLVAVGPPHAENLRDMPQLGGVPLLAYIPWMDALEPGFASLCTSFSSTLRSVS